MNDLTEVQSQYLPTYLLPWKGTKCFYFIKIINAFLSWIPLGLYMCEAGSAMHEILQQYTTWYNNALHISPYPSSSLHPHTCTCTPTHMHTISQPLTSHLPPHLWEIYLPFWRMDAITQGQGAYHAWGRIVPMLHFFFQNSRPAMFSALCCYLPPLQIPVCCLLKLMMMMIVDMVLNIHRNHKAY